MYLGKRVGVVVPAYNEAGHVREVVETLPDLVDRAYVVDDASTDGTWAEIRAAVRDAPAGRVVSTPRTNGAGRPDGGGPAEASPAADADEFPVGFPDGDVPPVVAVRHDDNRGRGGAVKTGYRLALADGMDVVAVMDGDGQMDPATLQRIVHPVAAGEADYAKGNRLDGPRYWDGMSRWRLFGNLLLTGLTRISSGYWRLRDPQNGYTAISRWALESVSLEDLYDDYGFLNDLLAALNVVGARVADVSMPAVYGDEESGIRYAQFVPSVSLLLLSNFLRRLYAAGEEGRFWIPATYGLAATGWAGAAVGGGLLATRRGAPSGETVATLAVFGVAVAVVAVLLDRRRNAPLEHRVRPAAGESG